jgi:TRAP-type uncharacterized transport system fused permease subunit
VISTITPPIALSAFAGAAVAGADPWKTSFKAVRYGIAAFLVPFLFISNQAILLDGAIVDIVRTTFTAGLGVWALAAASEGWLRCLIPGFDGAILSLEWKEAVWDRFVTGAPRPRTPSEQQYSDRKLRSRC